MTRPHATRRDLDTIDTQEEGIVILREALELAQRGWIRTGRDSTHDMVLDCIGRAAGQHDMATIANRAEASAYRALCAAAGGPVPKSNRLRAYKIGTWQTRSYMSQQATVELLRDGLEHAKQTLRKARATIGAGALRRLRAEARTEARTLLKALARAAEAHAHTEPDARFTIIDTLEGLGRRTTRHTPLRREAGAGLRRACTALASGIATARWETVHQRRTDAIRQWNEKTKPATQTIVSITRDAMASL